MSADSFGALKSLVQVSGRGGVDLDTNRWTSTTATDDRPGVGVGLQHRSDQGPDVLRLLFVALAICDLARFLRTVTVPYYGAAQITWISFSILDVNIL